MFVTSIHCLTQIYLEAFNKIFQDTSDLEVNAPPTFM